MLAADVRAGPGAAAVTWGAAPAGGAWAASGGWARVVEVESEEQGTSEYGKLVGSGPGKETSHQEPSVGTGRAGGGSVTDEEVVV